VLLTGLSGTGKSTVTTALAALGYKAVDVDAPAWSELTAFESSDLSGLGAQQDWTWREERISQLLAEEDADVLFVSGCASNQTKFYAQFDHIVLLTAPISVMTERLATRTTNAYGKDPEELARALALKPIVEPMLRGAAHLEIDTSAPLEQVVATIVRLVA